MYTRVPPTTPTQPNLPPTLSSPQNPSTALFHSTHPKVSDAQPGAGRPGWRPKSSNSLAIVSAAPKRAGHGTAPHGTAQSVPRRHREPRRGTIDRCAITHGVPLRLSNERSCRTPGEVSRPPAIHHSLCATPHGDSQSGAVPPGGTTAALHLPTDCRSKGPAIKRAVPEARSAAGMRFGCRPGGA